MKGRTRLNLAVVAAAATCVTVAWAGSNIYDGDAVGVDDLTARIGAGNVPTGAGVIVGQVEAVDQEFDYSPDQGQAQFTGKTFFEMSGGAGVSLHASTVAWNYYGNFLSIAPGISTIHLWSAGDIPAQGIQGWTQSALLRTDTGLPPLAHPAGLKVLNNSWLGTFGLPAINNDMLRRADWVINRDDLIMVVGVDNDLPQDPNDNVNAPLPSHVFNGLQAGVSSGAHMNDPTLPVIDGPGRMQPQIVAPGQRTSWAIPVISASAALMVETARTTPTLSGNRRAERSEVIKAVLLAGTTHRTGWTNNPDASGITSQPLDDVYGADQVDVNISHLILTGNEQDGSSSPPASANAARAGWDLTSVGIGESRFWRMRLCETAPELSVIATWHRQVQSPFGPADWAVADLDLILWRVNVQGQLESMVGGAGFSGNVVSESAVDNVEHLFVRLLEAGDYAFELRRVDGETDYPDWEAAVAWHRPASSLVGDIDGDCVVGINDLFDLFGAWGPCPDPCPVIPCPADLDNDCHVGMTDLFELFGNWD